MTSTAEARSPAAWRLINGCLKKRAYSSWADAEEAARRTMDESPDGKTLMAYHCRYHDEWHVGHRILPATARQRRRIIAGLT